MDSCSDANHPRSTTVHLALGVAQQHSQRADGAWCPQAVQLLSSPSQVDNTHQVQPK